MKYWWVNQNQTYAHEVRGGYLWSPKANANGASNRFYDNMLEVRPGDVVLSFCDTFIKAIGVATSVAESAPNPTSFGNAGTYWSNVRLSSVAEGGLGDEGLESVPLFLRRKDEQGKSRF